MSKPVIGITVGTSLGWRRSGPYYRSYAAPVEAAGGVCVRMGVRAGKKLAGCDGLLVTGGWDVHPDLYDRMPGDESLTAEEVERKYHVRCEEKRDRFELELIRQALDLGKPVLAICRGIQALNAVLARKLIPDIGICVPGALRHEACEDGVSRQHKVEIEQGSIVARAYGVTRLTVNTRHHQGMTRDMIPDSLRVTAIAPDWIVEAVEGVGEPFLVGVQWHPERKKDAFIHDISGPLFEAFVRACAA